MLKISWEKYASKVYFLTQSDGTVYEIGKTLNRFLYSRKAPSYRYLTESWIRLCIYWEEVSEEAVIWRYSRKKVFLEISQNLQEITCARVSRPATLLKVRLWTPLVAASVSVSLYTEWLQKSELQHWDARFFNRKTIFFLPDPEFSYINIRPFGNLGISIGIVKFSFPFFPFCEVKHLWWSPFQIHLQVFLRVFAAV